MSEFQAALKEELLKFEEEEVYEKIEAPKWVDLTRPDRSIPVDDVAWFCLKVGCDQKHEQPMDPAALKRSFLLRVMAARSPNVKCRRSPNVKCPLSAPPKSRYRTAGISRIPTLVSQKSISVAETGKVHPVLKLKSTPNNGKLRQNLVSVKALTTPRHKNFSTNQEPFRSVQNGKVRTFVPKTRMVAKALVFQTPKKEMKKKLEIGSSGKQAPEEQFVRSIRCARDDPSCSLPASTPVKKSHLRACKMNQTEKSSSSRNHKDSEVAVKYRKKRGVGNLKKNNGYVRQMDVADEKKLEQLVGGDESSDMEVDGNSRNCSLDTSFLRGNSGHCKRNEDGSLNASNSDRKGVSGINGEAPSKDINCRKNDEQTEGYLDPNPEEAQKEELDHRPTKENLVAPSRSENELGIMEPGNQSDRSLKNALPEELSSAREKSRMVLTEITSSDSLSHSKEKYLEEQGPLPQTSNRHDDDDDDKENTSASANNRDLKSTNHSERKLRKIEACENLQKTKTVQGIPTTATTAAQAGKHYKIKPTNPKPFRLRTDERGILKEANLERRLQLLSLKEAASNGNLQRWNGEKIQRDEKSHPQPGQSKSDSKQGVTSQVGTDRKIQKAKPQKVRPTCRKLEEACTDLKRVKKITHKQKLEESKDNKLAKLRQSKVLEHRPVRPPRVIAATDTHVRRIVREVLVAEACESPTKVCTTPITDRFSSRGRRPGTIPQEPNFHRINVPKTCTKTPIKEIS